MNSASLYDICYMLGERVKELEGKMEELEKEKRILSRAIVEKDSMKVLKTLIYY